MKNTGKNERTAKYMCGILALILLSCMIIMPGCKVINGAAEVLGETVANADYGRIFGSCQEKTSGWMRGCYTDDDALALVGTWKASNGAELRFDEKYMYVNALSFVLTEDIIDLLSIDTSEKTYQFEYAYNEDSIYLVVNAVYIKLLTAELDGDTLNVRFTENLRSVSSLELDKEYIFERVSTLSDSDS